MINVELQKQKGHVFHDSNKLVIARLSCTIWPIFSSFLIFCCYIFLLYFAVNKIAKYEKLGKYWLYCTLNRAITNAYPNCCGFKIPICHFNES